MWLACSGFVYKCICVNIYIYIYNYIYNYIYGKFIIIRLIIYIYVCAINFGSLYKEY